MATLVTRISDLATRIAAEIKSLHTLVNGNAADLSALTTTDKSSLVAALNELRSYAVSVIDDTATSASTAKTWSASKITGQINAAIKTDYLSFSLFNFSFSDWVKLFVKFWMLL